MNSMDRIQGTLKECDECGKSVVKIWCVHKGHRYCATCYARIFKRRMCPKCGEFSRLPTNDPDAVCRKCQKDKPCVRCGKTDYEIGKITPYGPVCNSCAPHFRQAEPCEVCNKPSSRLTRISRLRHGYRVCPKCARADHATCEACRRYRKLEESLDGHMLCKPCLENGNVPCSKCGASMPAGYGKQCQGCYWKSLLEKRIKIDSAAFSSQQMATHFRAFGQWLGGTVGEHKAALTIHRYLQFFLDIQREWKLIPEYSMMLAHFGTLHLRRVLIPMRWMEETGLLVPDATAKEEDSNRRRIAATLNKVPKKSPERLILDGYYKALRERLTKGETTIRSIRLALSPAAALLLKSREVGYIPPDQKLLDAFLEKTPGQRAAVSGFVRYLREIHKAKIALPKLDDGKAQRNRKQKLEAEMLELMQENGEGEEFRRRWLSVSLAYFHGLPRKIGKIIGKEHISSSPNGGVIVVFEGKSYWCPEKFSRRSEISA